jgi:hypothetical protein
MAQNFIGCDREQELLLPPSLREWLPEEHLAWFLGVWRVKLVQGTTGLRTGCAFPRQPRRGHPKAMRAAIAFDSAR